MIIDFHTHIFPEKIADRTLKKLGTDARVKPFTDGTAAGLASSMKIAGISYSVNLPVATNPGQVEKLNTSMIEQQESYRETGILVFGAMHPDYPDYKRELRRLKENGIPGIKLHPPYQKVDFDDPRMMRIIDAATEEGLIVLTHAGIDIGLLDKNYCSVKMILHVIDTVHPTKLVLAHMGGWDCWFDVAHDLAGAPVWLDTAFSIGPVTPNPDTEPPIKNENLADEAFIRLVRKHGTDRVLFGTDSPWSDQADFVARIKKMGFSETEETQIFSENALKLLNQDA